MCEAFILMIERDLSQEEYQELLRLVSPEKRERIGRFHRFEDAQRTLVGDVLIRSLIQKRLGIQNRDIIFAANKYGKPYLANHSEFHFNISHAGGYIACAIDDKPVGIDIEEIKAIDLKIAERFFSEEEIQYLLTQTGSERPKAFYLVWTMKEAYVKYKAKGLSIPLNSFNVFGLDIDAFFHRISSDENAICHVYTEQSEKPAIVNYTVEKLLRQLLKTTY